MENVLTLMLVCVGLAVAGRHLRVRWQTGSAVDALLLAWRKVWPAAPLTWAQLERRIWRRLCTSVAPGVSGHIMVPASFLVTVSPADFDLIGDAREAMAGHLASEMRKRARSKGWQIITGPAVVIRRDPDVYDGFPLVRHWFSENPPDLADTKQEGAGSGARREAVTGSGFAAEGANCSRPRWQPPSRLAHLGIDTVPMSPPRRPSPTSSGENSVPRPLAVSIGGGHDGDPDPTQVFRARNPG